MIKNLGNILKSIEQFNKLAQATTSAQAADIEDALRAANLFNPDPKMVGTLLDQAKVPETAKLNISIVVDKNLNVGYQVNQAPQGTSATAFANLLKKNFGSQMKKALADAKLNVSDLLTVKWFNV